MVSAASREGRKRCRRRRRSEAAKITASGDLTVPEMRERCSYGTDAGLPFSRVVRARRKEKRQRDAPTFSRRAFARGRKTSESRAAIKPRWVQRERSAPNGGRWWRWLRPTLVAGPLLSLYLFLVLFFTSSFARDPASRDVRGIRILSFLTKTFEMQERGKFANF